MSILLDLFYRRNSFAPFPFAKLKTNKSHKKILFVLNELKKKIWN